MAENPDILGSIANGKNRPTLVVGFAAETNDVIKHAKAKLTKKNCDMIVANDVSGDVMGGDENAMIIVSKNGEDAWPRMDKIAAAKKLAGVIATRFEEKT